MRKWCGSLLQADLFTIEPKLPEIWLGQSTNMIAHDNEASGISLDTNPKTWPHDIWSQWKFLSVKLKIGYTVLENQ